MLVKFFKPTASKGATGALDYLLNPDNRAVEPELISGNPDLTRQLLLASNFKNQYTAGCLSFAVEESDISKETEQALMQSFEETLLAGLEPNQYDILWIKHEDKGRLELNFHVLNTELQTGKRLQPYIHKLDCYRIDAWKSLQNDIYQLVDPNSPERSRTLQLGNMKEIKPNNIKVAVHEYLEELWINNEINNRDDIIKELKNIDGLEISRTTPSAISIKVPDVNKPIRLTGELYNEHFKSCESFTERTEQKQREYNQERERRIEVNREKLDKLNSKVRENRSKKYQYSIEIPEETEKVFDDISTTVIDSYNERNQRNIDVSENIRTVRENLARMQRIPSSAEAKADTILQGKTIEEQKEKVDRNGSEHRTFNTKLRAIAIAVRAAVQRFRSAFDIDRAQREREQAERIERINEQVRKTSGKKLRERTVDRELDDRTAAKQPVQNVQLRKIGRELDREGLEL